MYRLVITFNDGDYLEDFMGWLCDGGGEQIWWQGLEWLEPTMKYDFERHTIDVIANLEYDDDD